MSEPFDGWRRIRTFESVANRFTVCPLWPLGNPSLNRNLLYMKYLNNASTFLSMVFYVLFRGRRCLTSLACWKTELFLYSVFILSPDSLFTLFISPDDSSLGKIIRRKFDRYFISRENTDKIHTELATDMCKYHMFVFQFYFKHRVRQFLQNSAFYFDHICF